LYYIKTKFQQLNKIISIFIGLVALTSVAIYGYSQPYTLDIQIKNQPINHLILGTITGDDFKPLDTLLLHPTRTANSQNLKATEFTFPKNSLMGMYRLIFGQTTYEKIMDEQAQHIDFIFNDENLIFETDFNAPEDSILVVLSEESRVWFEFIQKEKKYTNELKELEMEVNYCQNKRVENTSTPTSNENKCSEYIIKYNTLQYQRDKLITEMVGRYPKLLATQMIKMYREPFLDGNLPQQQRKEIFQKEFFNSLDFTDERLINSSVYTDRIFYYLTSYNQPGSTKEQLENKYIKAVDVVLPNTNQNPKVYKFILDYMVHGFEVLKMDKVINYITENYS
jgi:hypothetical protein